MIATFNWAPGHGPLPLPSSSPDDRWLVYQSRVSGGGLYVQPRPGPGPRRQIAPEGALPMWRKDGKEILYRNDDSLMSIPVQWSATPTFGPPRELFTGLRAPAGTSVGSMPLAVSHDGTRIFSAQGIEQPESKVIHIKTGAFDKLR